MGGIGTSTLSVRCTKQLVVRLLDRSTWERPSGLVLTDPSVGAKIHQGTGTDGIGGEVPADEGLSDIAAEELRGVTSPSIGDLDASNAHRGMV
jgi:hypothetical protein